ncbi:MAG TPA: alanine--tRNA ligase [Victivallales bacterium]|nr:alanine--tRNA ligase [Victivallales bacterium]HPO91057.1 alanine--tRNA ligase [Victivallales bacterium]HRR06408.1 alanine--tRNA ligase [Victivallales bacterium]HRR27845.1 alanine--tRNA ligase [Victivallales bacterium]HRU01047.1 alanine--tRNA ligase [Victivallales bacterium]
MKASELRKKYIDFFKGKGHSVIKSAPLIPENDPTVLFTTAGMHPLVPFLLGEQHPLGKRLVNFQKCIRTGDIDEVGDAVHLTFFEMLGNWSLGDYFKKEAIEFSFEFLTSSEWLGLPVDKLAVTVFEGDNDAPFDQEAFDIWKKLGIPENRIARRPKKDNWWGPAGECGPCGPDTEMFFWTANEKAPELFTPDDKRWVEIWNDVFMQYNKKADGSFEPLKQKNVDTGMGLERVTAILQGKSSCYETELFTPIFNVISELSGKKVPTGDENLDRAARIIADHMRAATFIMADGISPGNVDQPYVLRRLIRRSIMQGRKLGLTNAFIAKIADAVIAIFADVYPELSANSQKITDEMRREEEQFFKTLDNGAREFERFISRVPVHIQKKVISGKNAFYLYETYGFPLELTIEMAGEKGFLVDVEGFKEAYKKHQELSRAGAEQKFKGGLADNSEMTVKLHTATHLLHKALRMVLGEHVEQKGSNITPERLRFDFSHSDKMTPEQISEVEKIVNNVIQKRLPVKVEQKTVEEALKEGAIGLFVEKYGEKVKVYSIGDFSKEICGGPHVENTGLLGKFKILKEESSSRGVRRIKAILTD